MTEKNGTWVWNDQKQLEIIKNMYAPTANDGEFNTFIQIGKATGLNPFLREIWLVKYGSNPAQIFIGRDGYRKSIGGNANYLSHVVDAVYENDEFWVDNQTGSVNHKYNLKDRGKIMGAYCCVYMKTAPRPFYVFVDFKEYNLGQSLWKTKPATMIKKVAECQAIRMAIPAETNGTYGPEEMEKPALNTSVHNDKLGVKAVKEKIKRLEDGVIIDKPARNTDQEDILTEIENAKTTEDLELIGKKIKDLEIHSEIRAFFAIAYKAKLNKLREENETKEE